MRAHPQGQALDESGTLASTSPFDRFSGHLINREDIIPINGDPRHSITPLFDKTARAGLFRIGQEIAY